MQFPTNPTEGQVVNAASQSFIYQNGGWVSQPVLPSGLAQDTSLQTILATLRTKSLVYTAVVGSPFALTSSWIKVATLLTSTRGLRIAPIASATTFDIEWVSVVSGAAIPTDSYGEPIFGGEDFAAGLPVGDLYLKSASGQVAIVKTGV